MDWSIWLWLTIGISMISAEAFGGNLHLLFLGLAALLTAISSSMGFVSLTGQITLFSLFSILGVFFLNRFILPDGKTSAEEFPEGIVSDKDMEAEIESHMIYKGARWKVFSKLPIRKGQLFRIRKVEGIRLIIEPK